MGYGIYNFYFGSFRISSFCALYSKRDSWSREGYGGEIGDFESIMIVSKLPIGEFRSLYWFNKSFRKLWDYSWRYPRNYHDAQEALEMSEVVTSISNSPTKKWNWS